MFWGRFNSLFTSFVLSQQNYDGVILSNIYFFYCVPFFLMNLAFSDIFS